MEDKELYNPQSGEKIAPKKPKKFWVDWRFYVYTLIAIMLAIVSFSSCLTACAAINAGVGSDSSSLDVYQKRDAMSYNSYGIEVYSDVVDVSWYRTGAPSVVGKCNIQANVYYWNDADCEATLRNSSGFTDVTCSNAVEGIDYAMDWVADIQYPSASYATQLYVLTGILKTSSTDLYWVYLTFYEADDNGENSEAQNTYVVLGFGDIPHTGYVHRYNQSDTSDVESGSFVLGDPPVISSYVRNGWYYWTTSDITSFDSLTLQDIGSYYSTFGYEDGYGSGYSAGEEAGYSAGEDAGYSAGYQDATGAYNTGIAFTSYGLYANASLTLVSDETIGGYEYMYLFDYITDTYDERSVYVLYLQNGSTGYYFGYVLDVSNSNDTGATYTIGSFDGQESSTVTITAELDRVLLSPAYITTFHDRGADVVGAFWFSGGTSTTAMQQYQDGYDVGFNDGQDAGYDNGYGAGLAVGRAQGMNEADPESLTTTLVTVFQQPFNQIYRFFNFNVLGLNILGIVSGLVSVLVIIKVFRKLYR